MKKILVITIYMPLSEIEDDVDGHTKQWQDSLKNNYTEFDVVVKTNFIISPAIHTPKLEYYTFEAKSI